MKKGHKCFHRWPYEPLGPHVGKSLTTIRAGHIDLERRIILKRIFKKWDWGTTDWIYLAQDNDRWLALVYAMMNLRIP